MTTLWLIHVSYLTNKFFHAFKKFCYWNLRHYILNSSFRLCKDYWSTLNPLRCPMSRNCTRWSSKVDYSPLPIILSSKTLCTQQTWWYEVISSWCLDSTMLFQNIGKLLPMDMASHPRKIVLNDTTMKIKTYSTKTIFSAGCYTVLLQRGIGSLIIGGALAHSLRISCIQQILDGF
jgi:hypothetical protein